MDGKHLIGKTSVIRFLGSSVDEDSVMISNEINLFRKSNMMSHFITAQLDELYISYVNVSAGTIFFFFTSFKDHELFQKAKKNKTRTPFWSLPHNTE